MASDVNNAQSQVEVARQLHDIKVTSMMRALQTQRDDAANRLVNLISEKAVLEHQYEEAQKTVKELTGALLRANSDIAELKVVNANLTTQLNEKKDEVAPKEADEQSTFLGKIKSLGTKA